MTTRHPNYRLVKIHRNFTVEEIARLLGKHRNTVREWIKQGLPTIDARRPALVLGSELSKFLLARRTRNKRPCQSGEIYCVRCRAPKVPAGGMVEYQPLTPNLGNLGGICPDCESMIYRRVNPARLEKIRGALDVSLPEAQPHIGESNAASVNRDFAGGLRS